LAHNSLKRKKQLAEVVLKFILQLPQWSFGWAQKAKCQTPDTYTERKEMNTQRERKQREREREREG